MAAAGRPRRLLQGAAALMVLPLVVAFLGTRNHPSGDVSVFLPLEQAELAQFAPDQVPTQLFVRYGFVRLDGRRRRSVD